MQVAVAAVVSTMAGQLVVAVGMGASERVAHVLSDDLVWLAEWSVFLWPAQANLDIAAFD